MPKGKDENYEGKLVSPEELKERLSMSLKDKIDFSAEKIEKRYDFYKGKVYVAFSGGKDSTVLLHLVRSIFPEIPAVYNDTGLEFPEIKEFVKSFDNVTITRPKLSFREVIEKYGYALVSKEQSRFISDLRNTKSEKLFNIRMNGNKWGMGKIAEKWKFLINADVKISHKCCDILKKNPAIQYEKKTGNKPFIGSLASESFMRKQNYLRFGCNMYTVNRPLSMPLAIWTEQDILQYIKLKNIKICSVYGNLLEKENGELFLDGYQRTGCMWCLFGIQQEESPNRIQKLKTTHPKIYEYIINDLKINKVLDLINVDWR